MYIFEQATVRLTDVLWVLTTFISVFQLICFSKKNWASTVNIYFYNSANTWSHKVHRSQQICVKFGPQPTFCFKFKGFGQVFTPCEWGIVYLLVSYWSELSWYERTQPVLA